jgi:hypothetical protein
MHMDIQAVYIPTCKSVLPRKDDPDEVGVQIDYADLLSRAIRIENPVMNCSSFEGLAMAAPRHVFTLRPF